MIWAYLHLGDRLERAESALAELTATPELHASNASAAQLSRAQGELLWARRDLSGAEAALRRSVSEWLEVSAPLHAAEVRVRLCQLLLEADDKMGAELELGSAEATFRQVSAAPLLDRCQALRQAWL